MQKWGALGCSFVVGVALQASAVTLSLDRVQQRYPWNGLVDIDYTVTLEPGEAAVSGEDFLEIRAIEKSSVPYQTNVCAAIEQGMPPLTAGKHTITWNANLDGVTYNSSQVDVEIVWQRYGVRYMVVDVSGGTSAASWPVTYLNAPPEGGFNTDEYKTGKIAFRLIHPGRFVAGSPEWEPNRNVANERQHVVTLTQEYYIGIFELTQQQMSYLSGRAATSPKKPYAFGSNSGGIGSGSVCFDPLNSRCKDAKTQAAVTGFCLPTECQWEYACRAGTTGGAASNVVATTKALQEAQLKAMGHCTDDSTVEVGLYRPNPWGLYDMHGNVWEFCSDWFVADQAGLGQVVDPVGPATGSMRSMRGGHGQSGVGSCRSASRSSYNPSYTSPRNGVRLACVPPAAQEDPQ